MFKFDKIFKIFKTDAVHVGSKNISNFYSVETFKQTNFELSFK
jgi:hypothetical protein